MWFGISLFNSNTCCSASRVLLSKYCQRTRRLIPSSLRTVLLLSDSAFSDAFPTYFSDRNAAQPYCDRMKQSKSIQSLSLVFNSIEKHNFENFRFWLFSPMHGTPLLHTYPCLSVLSYVLHPLLQLLALTYRSRTLGKEVKFTTLFSVVR